ncbi:CPCC family cysteine-rich protein [Subtercola sp. YIM 133946]|uniref:CPCC family cysteine-rich protein n=1 Tax=Subtercola sp. YIM 133946 TaxID=3118909 RepID=UPI002F950C93
MTKEPLKACMVCGNFTVRPVGWDVCRVCFWEDDGVIEPDRHSASNHMTVAEGREAFARYGAVEERFASKVRPPRKRERPENQPSPT